MAHPNSLQHIAVLDMNTTTQALIEAELALGKVITHIITLPLSPPKLLIIYATPPDPT